MKKSKETIRESLRLIFIIILIIWFLESNVCRGIREFVASYFSFFHGKREILSNIFIGILGSAVLLAFNEVLNYIHEKKKLQFRILELYKKWDQEIKYKDEIIADNIIYLNFIAPELKNFWNEIAMVYNEYLPYIRAGQYFKLIRTLFLYINEIKAYLDKVEYIQKERVYLLKSIESYEKIRENYSNLEINKEIDFLIESWKKQLEKIESEEIDEDKIIKEINHNRNNVVICSTTADVLLTYYLWRSIETQDKKNELDMKIYENEKKMRQIRRMQLVNKLKGFSIKNFYNKIKIKKLEWKYMDRQKREKKENSRN